MCINYELINPMTHSRSVQDGITLRSVRLLPDIKKLCEIVSHIDLAMHALSNFSDVNGMIINDVGFTVVVDCK